jgi:hypothetical protein
MFSRPARKKSITKLSPPAAVRLDPSAPLPRKAAVVRIA